MAAWSIVIMVMLAVAIGIFVFLTISTESSNKKNQQANILYPFSGYLAPPNPPWTVRQNKNNPGIGKEPEDGLYLVGMAGGKTVNTPQIQCPAGYHINIVGAFLDVADPYGECSNNPNPLLEMTCGDPSNTSASPACDNSDACGVGMTCYSGRCVPSQCSTSADCGGVPCDPNIGSTEACNGKGLGDNCGNGAVCASKGGVLTCEADPGSGACMMCVDPDTGTSPMQGSQGYCASMPTCIGVQKGLNTACSPSLGDTNKCRPRDASAYLAGYCDGKSKCLGASNDIWRPNVQGGPFGPLPCRISASSSSEEYSHLPIVTGWGGGPPDNSQSGTSEPASFNQGYYVHGIYTCVPNSENTSAENS